MKRNIINRTKKAIILFGIVCLISCGEDFLNPDVTEYATKDQIDEMIESGGGESVVALLESTMLGAYNATVYYQGRHDAFSEMSTRLSGDMMTEDIAMNYSSFFSFDYQIDNNASSYARPINTWSYLYSVVGKCNEVIEKVEITEKEKLDARTKSVLGQALSLRAYAFFTLVQRFQKTYKGNEEAPGIPLSLTTKDTQPSVKGRGTTAAVYAKILEDMKEAIDLLEGAKRASKMEIDQQVAAGLYARMLMVVEDWEQAAFFANMAKEGYTLMTADEFVADGFNNIGNKEWMWGFDITGETASGFASFLSHICSYDVGYGESTFAPKMIDARLYGMMNVSDARRKQFKDPTSPVDPSSSVVEQNAPSYCNFKFKKVEGWLADYVYMRVAEMYLIEAEALAHQNKGKEAFNVLKLLMDNRDVNWASGRTTVSVEDVFLQKRLELWGEGHIFYDYLRLKKGVDRSYTGSNHLEKRIVPAGSWKFIYQLPQGEIDNNDNLSESDQNPVS